MNMIRQIAALCVGAAVALPAMGVVSASDRLDITDVAGQKHYVMISQIASLTYTHPETAGISDKYTHVVVTLRNGQQLTMPLDECRELLYTHVDKTPYAITNKEGEHGSIRMLYNFNDPDSPDCYSHDLPYGWRGSWADGPVFFLSEPERGYIGKVHVVGDFTGTEYHNISGFISESIPDENYRYGINLDCLEFTMPFEPVTISLETTPESKYAGKDFIGLYTGCLLCKNGGSITEIPRNFSIELRESGAYTLICADDPAINIIDYYTFDEEKGTFSYIASENDIEKNEFEVRIRYGANGRLLAGGKLAWVKVRDVVDNRAETNRYYVATREDDLTFTIAESIGGRRQLIEADGTYVFVDEYGEEPFDAIVEFRSGNTIKEECVATITTVSASPRVFRLNYAGGNAEPEFIPRGAEAGTFTNGTQQIELDGFDSIIIDGKVYTYTINGANVTVTIDGHEVIYVLDLQSRTFTVTATAGVWNGPKEFHNATAKYGSGSNPDLSGATIDITFDRAYNGTEKPGYMIAKATCSSGSILEVYGDYIYNPTDKMITLSKAWIGTSANTAAYCVMVFRLSDDLQSIWIDDAERDRIYATSRNGYYIYTGAINTATAQ